MLTIEYDFYELFQPNNPKLLVFKFNQYLYNSNSLVLSLQYLLWVLEKLHLHSDRETRERYTCQVAGMFADRLRADLSQVIAAARATSRPDKSFTLLHGFYQKLERMQLILGDYTQYVFLHQEVNAAAAQVTRHLKSESWKLLVAMQTQMDDKDYELRLILTKDEKKCIFDLVQHFSGFYRRGAYRVLNVYEKVMSLQGPITTGNVVEFNRLLTKANRTFNYYGYSFEDLISGEKTLQNLRVMCVLKY